MAFGIGLDTQKLVLESQKESIATSAATQKAIQGRNPNRQNNVDFTSSFVSIFGDQIRAEVRYKTDNCNNLSDIVGFNSQKTKQDALTSCREMQAKVAELEELYSWASGSANDLSKIDGISEQAINTAKQSISDTMKYASSMIKSSIAYANEALSKIKVVEPNTEKPQQATGKEQKQQQPQERSQVNTAEFTNAINETQKNLNDIAKQTVYKDTESFDNKTPAEKASVIPDKKTESKTSEIKDIGIKNELKNEIKQPEVKMENTKIAEKTEAPIPSMFDNTVSIKADPAIKTA